jgi:chromosome segregation ATPase
MPVFSKHTDREFEALEKTLKAAEEKLKSLEEKLLEQKAATKGLDEQRKAAEKAQAEQKEENDLLLAQLHQVQEELEKYFLENKTQQEASATLKEALAKANAELKKAQDHATASAKQLDEFKTKLLETEKKLVEANKLIKSEGDAKVNEVQKQKAELEKRLAEADAAADAAGKSKAELEALRAVEADLKSENDLLLAQLHQVQEELEKYYLGNKDLESAVTQASDLIRRARQAMVMHHANSPSLATRPVAARQSKARKKP